MQRLSLRARLRAVSQENFIAEKLRPLPAQWAGRVLEKYRAIEARAGAERPANLYLLEQSEALGEIKIPFNAGDGEIIALAKLRADTMLDLAGRAPVAEAGAVRRYLEGVAASWGIRPFGCEVTHAGVIARLTDALWWRRQLRALHARKIEGAAISLGYVHRRAELYCSDVTLIRRQQQKRRNAATLEAVTAINENGDEFTLAELAARSVANPRIRRGELMTRIAGFEAVAQGMGHAAEFVTLTCPSRMHARLSKSGDENPSYDGTAPREAQRYLTRVWARIRAAWARVGIEPYGFRIAEPHHDGTPHWHMLFFMPAERVQEFRRLLVRYALADAGDEPGARRNRVKFVSIDWRRGSAAGYVAKYVAKNIDGYGVGSDLFGNDAVESSARVEAWASTWGIRQFQQIGGPPVGVWRELRRLPETEAGRVGRARAAADAGNWRAYCEAMGGTAKPVQKVRSGRAVRYWPLAVATKPAELTDARTGEILPLANRYGEPATPRPAGVLDRLSGAVFASLRHVWVIVRRAISRVAAVVRRPWTCVNNCTGALVPVVGAGGHFRSPIETAAERATRETWERWRDGSISGGDSGGAERGAGGNRTAGGGIGGSR